MIKTLVNLPTKLELNSDRVLKKLVLAHRYLAELKGIVNILPNKNILFSNVLLKEAKDSSAIENIITTQDSLYKHHIQLDLKHSANKEVSNYSKALAIGYQKVKKQGGISIKTILYIQSVIEPKRAGFRRIPGTVIKNMMTGQVIYKPPTPEKISKLMYQLEKFIYTNSMDPLIKMALIHHYFESIHPFYNGNGRTGRIINILYLIQQNLLNSPVLYISKYILKHKADYYKLLQQVRKKNNWADWIVYMLEAVSITSMDTIQLIKKLDSLFKEYKKNIRTQHKFYSHELINNIFIHPYTKVKFLEQEMKVSRATASRYLDLLARDGILEKNRLGKENYYINKRLFNLLQKY